MLSDAEISAIANYIRSTSQGMAVDALSRWLDHERREGIDSEWLAAHDAEVARKTLEDAISDIHKQAVAELNGKRHGNSTAVRTAFGSGAELAKRILRARAASISTDKAGAEHG